MDLFFRGRVSFFQNPFGLYQCPGFGIEKQNILLRKLEQLLYQIHQRFSSFLGLFSIVRRFATAFAGTWHPDASNASSRKDPQVWVGSTRPLRFWEAQFILFEVYWVYFPIGYTCFVFVKSYSAIVVKWLEYLWTQRKSFEGSLEQKDICPPLFDRWRCEGTTGALGTIKKHYFSKLKVPTSLISYPVAIE